jgi:hypothetical protein
MSVKNKITYKIPPNVVETVTTSPGVDVRDMMLKDSTDLLDNVEVTTIAQECVKLKAKEDEIAKLEEQLKNKKAEADDIGSRVIPELLAEQGLSEIKLADGSKVSVKKEYRCTLPKDESKRAQCYQWLRDQDNGFEPQQKSDVAWATLTALFRERIESGLDMPSDVFSTWIKDRTKITRK